MKNSLTLLLLLGAFWATAQQYASKETEQIIQQMITAHGGYEKWAAAPTFSFQNTMFSASLPGSPFWINEVTVEKGTRRVHQDWPIHQASFTHDGKDTWSTNWRLGNPPKFEALFFYYFLNLPWLTQEESVVLGEAQKQSHPLLPNDVYKVEMSYKEKPAVGKTEKDKYVLYIDAQNHRLIAYEYYIGYGHMLDVMGIPQDQELFGPMFRINQHFTEVDGLLYPVLMQTGNQDMSQVYGNHAIINYDLQKPFNKEWLERGQDAVLDASSAQRVSGTN